MILNNWQSRPQTKVGNVIMLCSEGKDGRHTFAIECTVSATISSDSKEANAIIIPIPSVEGEPGSSRGIVGLPFNNFGGSMRNDFAYLMGDYKRLLLPAPVLRGKTTARSRPVVVKGSRECLFKQLIAPNAKSIEKLLQTIEDRSKRPPPNLPLYEELDEIYEGNASFLVLCFNPTDAEQVGREAITYRPRNLEELFLPTLTGPGGRICKGEVKLDQTLVIGSGHEDGHGPFKAVTFTNQNPQTWLTHFPDYVIGKIVDLSLPAPRGDFVLQTRDVRKGIFNAKLVLPSGWHKVNVAHPAAQGKDVCITADSVR